MSTTSTRDDLATGLVRIGERAIARGDDAALDAYFADGFRFHGPTGDLGYEELKASFAAMRAAFEGFTVTRGHIVVEDRFVGSQTTMAGTFAHDFTHSPVGVLPPTGRPVALHLINIFRYDDDGRLAEEWVQYDERGWLRQLGVEQP